MQCVFIYCHQVRFRSLQMQYHKERKFYQQKKPDYVSKDNVNTEYEITQCWRMQGLHLLPPSAFS